MVKQIEIEGITPDTYDIERDTKEFGGAVGGDLASAIDDQRVVDEKVEGMVIDEEAGYYEAFLTEARPLLNGNTWKAGERRKDVLRKYFPGRFDGEKPKQDISEKTPRQSFGLLTNMMGHAKNQIANLYRE